MTVSATCCLYFCVRHYVMRELCSSLCDARTVFVIMSCENHCTTTTAVLTLEQTLVQIRQRENSFSFLQVKEYSSHADLWSILSVNKLSMCNGISECNGTSQSGQKCMRITVSVKYFNDTTNNFSAYLT